jgi:hypothetical protein
MDSDVQRRQALENARIEVVQITWTQYANQVSWDAICHRLALHLGKRNHQASQRIRAKQLRVHDDFCSWDCLRVFPASPQTRTTNQR